MFTRKERTQILCEIAAEQIGKLKDALEKQLDIVQLEAPRNGLLMVKMRDSARLDKFYLGEVLITECKVLLADTRGLGIVRGSDPERAYCMALIDAVYNANHPLVKQLEQQLTVFADQIAKQLARRKSDILQTKVDFETLDEAVKS